MTFLFILFCIEFIIVMATFIRWFSILSKSTSFAFILIMFTFVVCFVIIFFGFARFVLMMAGLESFYFVSFSMTSLLFVLVSIFSCFEKILLHVRRKHVQLSTFVIDMLRSLIWFAVLISLLAPIMTVVIARFAFYVLFAKIALIEPFLSVIKSGTTITCSFIKTTIIKVLIASFVTWFIEILATTSVYTTETMSNTRTET